MSAPDYENKYDVEDEPGQWLGEAVRNNHTGDIHFGAAPRFISSMDQTRWTFLLYSNWVRCREKLGEDAPRCEYLYQKMNAVTPTFIKEAWDEQLENGVFPGYDPAYKPEPLVIDYSLKPTRGKSEHH
mgnify:CR=1 FL=1